ncbi:uncharacterized protein PG986_010317 [Apiospora aurea]|uniref:Uncharacterized protein n=1 Tax=Apiospora aurea TaxID=335848 RepID=A0ABR1Q1V5_9PEZI
MARTRPARPVSDAGDTPPDGRRRRGPYARGFVPLPGSGWKFGDGGTGRATPPTAAWPSQHEPGRAPDGRRPGAAGRRAREII